TGATDDQSMARSNASVPQGVPSDATHGIRAGERKREDVFRTPHPDRRGTIDAIAASTGRDVR
ncbi:MAG: hypothetical protein KDJ81_04060, partial [Rhodobacteraceae bacterium]|nr:hypothetical protein [Paracoccaceae bacterium]